MEKNQISNLKNTDPLPLQIFFGQKKEACLPRSNVKKFKEEQAFQSGKNGEAQETSFLRIRK